MNIVNSEALLKKLTSNSPTQLLTKIDELMQSSDQITIRVCVGLRSGQQCQGRVLSVATPRPNDESSLMLLDEANHLTFLKISDISFIRIEQVPFQLAEALSEGEISAIDAIEPLGKIGLRKWTVEVEKQISESTNLNVEITFHEGLDLETEASRLNCQVALTYMLSTVQGWSGDEETIGLIKGKLKSIELSNSDTTLSDGVLSLMVSDEIKSNSKANFTEKVESLF